MGSFQGGLRKVYDLSYGNDAEMPHCACFSWRDSAYPCKHFFAAIERYPEWNWNMPSKLFTNSSFLILDLSDTVGFLENNDTQVIIDDGSLLSDNEAQQNDCLEGTEQSIVDMQLQFVKKD